MWDYRKFEVPQADDYNEESCRVFGMGYFHVGLLCLSLLWFYRTKLLLLFYFNVRLYMCGYDGYA